MKPHPPDPRRTICRAVLRVPAIFRRFPAADWPTSFVLGCLVGLLLLLLVSLTW